jgi:hypothetical protein
MFLRPLLSRIRRSASPLLKQARPFGSSAANALSNIAVPAACGYAIVCAVAFAAQRKLQYFPAPSLPDHPAKYGAAFADVEEIETVAADGTRCQSWHWPAPEADASPAPAFWLRGAARDALQETMAKLRSRHRLRNLDLLMMHGNAGHREGRLLWMFLLREGLGCSVTVLDYRGYGGSDGAPTEAGMIADGAAALEWLRERGGAGADRRLVLWGESIGCGVAVALASEQARAATEAS